MIVGLFIFVGLTSGLAILARKFCKQNAGLELGHKNNIYWGMEEDNNRY